jgi:hypothetical protein
LWIYWKQIEGNKLRKKKNTKGLFGKSSTKFSFSFFFSQKYQIKNILTFLHFLHHINNFLLLFNQKNSLQNKTFSLFYKTFSNFLSHQSFLTTIQINIPIHNHLPNKPLGLTVLNLLSREIQKFHSKGRIWWA